MRESPKSQTHYDFFPSTLPSGAPPRGPFDVNLSELRKEFYQLQAKAHPDRARQEEKGRAEGLSMRINEAYRTLQDPLRRAQYLLYLKGTDMAEVETAKVEDSELLMEVLETREAIEAIEEESELKPLIMENTMRIEESIMVLDQAFKQDNMDTARTEVVKLRYWINIRESLNAWEAARPVVLVH